MLLFRARFVLSFCLLCLAPKIPAQPLFPSPGKTEEELNGFTPGFTLCSDETVRNQITSTAMKYLGVRYRSSGKNPKAGFDCSGFTGFVFKKAGIQLKASSPAQAMEGRKIAAPEARKGDLAFFGYPGRKGRYRVNHAAIVISNPGEPLAIIHAANRKGITITRVMEDPYWRRTLLFVRSVL
jgi:cell wall-associated NlpC family hydrolase